MTKTAKEEWQRVRAIFDDALRQPVEDRVEFVRETCGADPLLFAEVESLLSSLESAEQFLETPAVVQVTENFPDTENRLASGEILLHYEIRELLGSGGMGEVYLARDTRLNRNVAIKVLRASFLPDTEGKRRLLREARAAALLEHPNICQIYEISEADNHSFIVMQYVVGQTLAAVTAEKRLTVGEVLDIAVQIMEGLAEAHDRGIVHRDIKPANIIITPKGRVKILDFGLAKFFESDAEGDSSTRLNSSGLVMGTVPFMSPEQLCGNPVDARSDIFSVGALLYEMLTGTGPFNRDSNAETISAILNDDPDWAKLPAELRSILQRCLAKNTTQRYSSAHELLYDLDAARKVDSTFVHAGDTTVADIRPTNDPLRAKDVNAWESAGDVSGENVTADSASIGPRLSQPALVAGLIGATMVVIVVAWLWQSQARSSSPMDSLSPVRLISWKTAGASNSSDFRISHNGKMLAYSSSQHGGAESIYIKQTSDGADFQVTKDPWSNVSPLWSPDDQKIAFVSIRQDQPGIYVSPTLGGPITPLLVTDEPNVALRHWSRDGSTIFYERAGALYRLDVSTGETGRIPSLPDPNGRNNRYYEVSPDETRVVYCNALDGQTDLWIAPLTGGESTRLTNDSDVERRPIWHPDGERILYNLLRNEFFQINLVRLDSPSQPAQVTRGAGHYVLIGVPDEGDRLYYSSVEWKSDISNVDLETGRETEVAAQPEVEWWLDVSPDGGSVVYHLTSRPIPTRELSKSTLVIKTSDGRSNQLSLQGFDARWLPDSRHLVLFRSSTTRPNDFDAWIIDTITGHERMMTTESLMTPSYSPLPMTRTDISVLDFSPDGQEVAYLEFRRPQNVKIASLSGGDSRVVTQNTSPDVTYYSPKFSPDGSTLVFVSQEQSKGERTWRVNSVTGSVARVLLSGSEPIRLLGWSGNEDVIVGVVKGADRPEPANVEILAINSDGTTRKLISLTGVYPATLTLTRDSRMIAYTRREGELDDIWRVGVAPNSAPRRITSNGTTRQFLTNLVFSPDGKSIYFDKQEEINTISMFENFNQ